MNVNAGHMLTNQGECLDVVGIPGEVKDEILELLELLEFLIN